ncbi:hypothetical protein BATDEDRAFT_89787 [Batrachochytrium dendrobatidis JAM81]|uniref:Uncharacterized protein n=1 Tax=Batrachochytrium dendrobatidis (strain JAM81 / FGSC 10211) TaxID=684364 RepID=F4P5J0_BATDJ|nr:uncharacterized protein BATDEDRAFT_89787 [Batrachochytrium dendrobatidis JAM81]EGF79425.1 hypothetical protein BATDEDRAFT_89787 [Batrachochytrium dendrobatidis JAM81]|eukprot:XP_006680149.1 hypothetical protein BATDEDRAFT_89787 [Batrachochytrium dendrobatidis JAM81]
MQWVFDHCLSKQDRYSTAPFHVNMAVKKKMTLFIVLLMKKELPVGVEPTALRLKAARSTTELREHVYS